MLSVRSRFTAYVVLSITAILHTGLGVMACLSLYSIYVFNVTGQSRVRIGVNDAWMELLIEAYAVLICAWQCVYLWVLRHGGGDLAYCFKISVPVWGGWRFARDVIEGLRYAERVRSGRCLHCGYDLRASKDRCPECGSPMGTGMPR